MPDFDLLERVAGVPLWMIFPIPLVLAITLHEAAHGWAAARLGDTTAKDLGRLTLNPIKHIDPIGTVVVPVAIIVAAKFMGLPPILFGWAKPVPVNLRRLFRPRRDMALVALAGPGSNLLMGLAWALVARAALVYHGSLDFIAGPLFAMAIVGIFGNSILFALNLLPLPPLDGGRILVSALPPRAAAIVARVEPFGLPILVLAIGTGVLWVALEPLLLFALSFMDIAAGDSLHLL